MACNFWDITVSQLDLDEVMDNSFVFDNVLYSFIKIIYNPHNILLNKLVFGGFIKNIRTY